MSEPVEHQSFWDGGHQDWRPDATCPECTERALQNRARLNSGTVGVVPSFLDSKQMDHFLATGDPEQSFGKSSKIPPTSTRVT